MFRVKVNKNSISVTEKDTMTSGSVNVYPVEFEFNASDWDGLIRIALFKNESKTIQYILDETNRVQMPWELMVNAGSKISVGVCGHNGDEIILPSQWAACGSVIEGVHYDHGGSSPSDPPPSGLSLEMLAQKISELENKMPTPISEEDLDYILKEENVNG